MKKALNSDIEAITTPKKLTRQISLLSTLTVLVFAGICYWILDIEVYIPLTFVSFSLLNLGVYVIFVTTKNVKLVYKITSILIFSGAGLMSLMSGGITSPFIFFLPLVIISGYAMSMRYGNIWLAVSMMAFVAIFLIDEGIIEKINGVAPASRYAFSFMAILLATIVLGGIYGRYLADTIYKSIKKNIEIGEKNHENEILLKEVQYRVKNNLRIIARLLSLQSNFIEDEKEKMHLQFSQYRVKSMALIHDRLYQSENISKINFKSYARDLANSLVKSFKGAESKIEIMIDSKDIFFNMDTAIPLGLLTNEILTNSLRHSLKGGTGTISIKLEALHEPNFILEIGDNGIGFSEEVQFDTLGLELIESLALQLNGHIEKDTSKKGANYVIVFQEIASVG